jgi:hypothetical protein
MQKFKKKYENVVFYQRTLKSCKASDRQQSLNFENSGPLNGRIKIVHTIRFREIDAKNFVVQYRKGCTRQRANRMLFTREKNFSRQLSVAFRKYRNRPIRYNSTLARLEKPMQKLRRRSYLLYIHLAGSLIKDRIPSITIIKPQRRKQGFGSGSGSVVDPDSIRSVVPESGSRSRRAKMTHKSRKKLRNFMF